ncbi:MAG: hypothetical protein ACU85U_19875 [Gammaproteobacteria bacterium]
MAQNKTKPTQASVAAFLNAIKDKEKRRDCKRIAAMMRAATGERSQYHFPTRLVELAPAEPRTTKRRKI